MIGTYSEVEISGLKDICKEVLYAEEQDRPFFILKDMKMPPGADPQVVDALLCPVEWNGYPSRLLFSQKVALPNFDNQNWNVNGERILENIWYGFSWKHGSENLSLIRMVIAHLNAKKT